MAIGQLLHVFLRAALIVFRDRVVLEQFFQCSLASRRILRTAMRALSGLMDGRP
jgi:hypothetical protein